MPVVKVHPRTKIREAIVESLKGLATSLNNVKSNQLDATRRGERAEVIVRTPQDILDEESATMRPNETRILTILIEAKVAAPEDEYEDTLDDLAFEIKERIFETTYLEGKFQILWHVSDELEYDGESERSNGIIRMTFTGYYRISILAPETLLDIN